MSTDKRPARALVRAGWLVAGGLGIAAVTRLSSTSPNTLMIATQATAAWLLLPSYPLALVAWWQRRFALGIVACALVACQIYVVLASGGHGKPAPDAGRAGFKVISSNVLLDNQDLSSLVAQWGESKADLVLLQEITPEHAAELAATRLWTDFPFRLLDPRSGYHGSAIFSRYPIVEGGSFDVAGSPMLRATVETPEGPLRVINVHTVAPLTRDNAVTWIRQLQELTRIVRDTKDRILLAGDFNATLDHSHFRKLVESGVVDSFSRAGSGLGATWPQWGGLWFPLMRLDHVLVSDSIAVHAAVDQPAPGSDHRSLSVVISFSGTA